MKNIPSAYPLQNVKTLWTFFFVFLGLFTDSKHGLLLSFEILASVVQLNFIFSTYEHVFYFQMEKIIRKISVRKYKYRCSLVLWVDVEGR